MRTIKVELTIVVPDNYPINFSVDDLLYDMEDMYSDVSFVEGRIIGQSHS